MRALAVAAALVLLATPVAAQPELTPDAQSHLDAGLALYDAGDYNAATVELETAYRLDPQPQLFFAIAQAKRLGGRCDEAVPMYEKFLTTHPGASELQAAETGISLCKDELTVRDRDRAFITAAPTTEPTPARPGRGWRIAAFVSGATTLVAATLYTYASIKVDATEDALKDATTDEEIQRLNAEGERYSTSTFISGPVMLIGGAVCLVSLYKGFISPPKESKRIVVTPTVSPTAAGASVTYSW
jgi:tetratricopeptide (TPR) repeat protein